MRVEPGYNMTTSLKVGVVVGSSVGKVAECNLIVIVWSARQKGRLEQHDIAWDALCMGLGSENLL